MYSNKHNINKRNSKINRNPWQTSKHLETYSKNGAWLTEKLWKNSRNIWAKIVKMPTKIMPNKRCDALSIIEKL